MKTVRKTAATFSERGGCRVLDVNVPVAWHELTQEQLKKALQLLVSLPATNAQVAFFLHVTGITVVNVDSEGYVCESRDSEGLHRFRLRLADLTDAIGTLDWMLEPPMLPVRLDSIGNAHALEDRLHGFRFEDYLYCENLYQSYLSSKVSECLDNMLHELYNGSLKGHFIADADRLNVFNWWAGLKNLFSSTFPNLFKTSSGSSAIDQERLMAMVNALVRALTGGDVTKTQAVYDTDVWIALAELDAKAADAERQQREVQRMKRKK